MGPVSRVLALLVLAGCSVSAQTSREAWTQADYEAELARLDAEIRSAAGEARAEDEGACRVTPYGETWCRIPAYYLPYSITAGDPERLERLAVVYTALDRERRERFGLYAYPGCPVADLVPHLPALEDGRCVIRERR